MSVRNRRRALTAFTEGGEVPSVPSSLAPAWVIAVDVEVPRSHTVSRRRSGRGRSTRRRSVEYRCHTAANWRRSRRAYQWLT